MRLFYFGALALFALSLCAVDAHGVTIAWSPVGNPGNVADTAIMTDGTTGYGSVPYAYRIGTYDVTNSQYADFLNIKDPSGANVLGLYNPAMAHPEFSFFGGINFNSAGPSGSKYTLIAGAENHPVNWVSWYDSIRFANWLNNGQGNGDTETGAYTLGPVSFGGIPFNGNLITRNAGATVFLPSENEWYKAAYYDPTTSSSYFKYATSSNTQPAGTAPPGSINSANYFGSHVDHPTDVGAYASSHSPYGTFDQAGNVYQWNEAFIGGAFRGLRGGSFHDPSLGLQSTLRSDSSASGYNLDLGFRVAMTPEPSSFVMAGFALLGLLAWGRRCRGLRCG